VGPRLQLINYAFPDLTIGFHQLPPPECGSPKAGVDARYIRAEVTDHTSKLYGQMHPQREAGAARAAAAAAPGIASVESHLLISP
jgi:hypothetical protein